MSRLIEQDEVGDDDPANGQDERSGDVEEAEPSENRLGSLEAGEEGLQHLLLLPQRAQGCSSKALKALHGISLDIAGDKCNVEESDGGRGEDHDEEPKGHRG